MHQSWWVTIISFKKVVRCVAVLEGSRGLHQGQAEAGREDGHAEGLLHRAS